MTESTLPLSSPTELTLDDFRQVSGGQSVGQEMEEAVHVPIEANPLIKNWP